MSRERGGFARTLADEGGIPSMLWAGGRKKNEPSRLDIRVELEDFEYSLSCGPESFEGVFRLDAEVKEERAYILEGRRRHLVLERKNQTAFLRTAEGERASFPIALWGNESVLAQITEPYRFPVLSALRAQFQGRCFYHHFRTDPEAALRQPQVGVRTPALSHDGRDLAAALLTIFDLGDGQELTRHLNRAFPGAQLEVEGGSSRLEIMLSLPGLQRPLGCKELSDGTLRYVCLLATLFSPRPPSLLVLNEPETSLHPDLLSPLAALLEKASERSQLIVTTHSDVLAAELARLTGRPPLRLEKRDGCTELAEPQG